MRTSAALLGFAFALAAGVGLQGRLGQAAATSWVRITTPTNGAIFEGGAVVIGVSVQLTGAVNWVTFFAGTNQLGIDTSDPYSFAWSPPGPGRYALRAVAVGRGEMVESVPVHIQHGQVSYDELSRGPYLQSGSPSSMVVRWRTDWMVGTHLWYGEELDNLDSVISEATPKTEHEVRLSALSANKRYYYALYSDRNVLAAGSDCTFVTAPRVGTAKAVRIWAIGDSGTADYHSRGVRDGYLWYADGASPDVWLMLGDNAYESGSDVEYQKAVFDVYTGLLRRTVLWPTIGNHDVGINDDEFPYLSIFTLPRQGEAGGVASGTERYYSFDYANIHFICLDPTSSPTEPGGAMLTWLENDLMATTQQWIIAFWHYPPYSKGSHDSDRERDLVHARERLLPVLEDYGVDLVLTGHSHNYERSYLLAGHYGYSTNLQSDMVLDAGSGRADEDGPYRKPPGALGDRGGCVYVVCGCSGEGGATSVAQHPAMRVALGGFGSMVIDVSGPRLDAKFIRPNAVVEDYFTILKDEALEVAPHLKVTRVGDKARVLWPANAPGTLEAAALSSLPQWGSVTNPVSLLGLRNFTDVTPSETQQVFRLRRPISH